MRESVESDPSGAVRLPPDAPKVRITAGLGTAAQKTWNLRRPVTVIGASRMSHIVLPHDSVSRTHCIIVNTGEHVLLKDLCSTNGTHCNERAADLVVLNDGDAVQLGDTSIQVAIQGLGPNPAETDAGILFRDPLSLQRPLTLTRPDSPESSTIDEMVAIIGHREGVCIRVDHPDVSAVHAALVCIGGQMAVFDLSSAAGTTVNDRHGTLTALNPGDRLKLGSVELRLEGSAVDPQHGPFESAADEAHPDAARLAALETELRARTRALDEREAALEARQVELDAASVAVNHDRRALEQQAMALWQARTELEIERKAIHRSGAAGHAALTQTGSASPVIVASNTSV